MLLRLVVRTRFRRILTSEEQDGPPRKRELQRSQLAREQPQIIASSPGYRMAWLVVELQRSTASAHDEQRKTLCPRFLHSLVLRLRKLLFNVETLRGGLENRKHAHKRRTMGLRERFLTAGVAIPLALWAIFYDAWLCLVLVLCLQAICVQELNDLLRRTRCSQRN